MRLGSCARAQIEMPISIDGELFALDENGVSHFNKLQKSIDPGGTAAEKGYLFGPYYRQR